MTQIVPAKSLEAKIRKTKDLRELKELCDKAEAIRAYVRKAGDGFKKQNQYAEVKIRAERYCGEILASEVEQGGDRKSKSRFDRRTLKDLGVTKYQSHCWQLVAKLPDETFEGHIARVKDANNELTSKSVYKLANEFQKELKEKGKPVPGSESVATPIRIKFINCDFMECIDQFEDVDAIITDPPYSKKHLGLYENLARFAARVLKPGGSLLTMAGVQYLPQVLEIMTPHINYHWSIACHMPGKLLRVWHRKVMCSWKPILWFTNGRYQGNWTMDVTRANVPEKKLHPWQQAEAVFESLIESVTQPGQLILDPFFGSGTVGSVAIKMNRRIVGIDIDPVAIETAEERLGQLAKKIVWPSFCSNPGLEQNEIASGQGATARNELA